MARPQDPRLKLSFEQANAICRGFLPIGDQIFEYMARLRVAGFEAFLPRHAYVESFAANPEEVEIHRRCIVETAKERLARPWPMRIYDEELKQVWESPFLQDLRAERDRENGVPVDQLSRRCPGGQSAWRRHVDPCQRRLVQMEVHQSVMLELMDAYRHGLNGAPADYDRFAYWAKKAAAMGSAEAARVLSRTSRKKFKSRPGWIDDDG